MTARARRTHMYSRLGENRDIGAKQAEQENSGREKRRSTKNPAKWGSRKRQK
jgi:hypothetical protein